MLGLLGCYHDRREGIGMHAQSHLNERESEGDEIDGDIV